MYYGSGHAFLDKTFSAKADCPNCGSRMIFKGAETLARENGITDNVVMCGSCRHVYTYVLIPGRLTLDVDVTGRYPRVQMGEQAKDVSGAQPEAAEARPRKKPGFLAKLFGTKK